MEDTSDRALGGREGGAMPLLSTASSMTPARSGNSSLSDMIAYSKFLFSSLSDASRNDRSSSVSPDAPRACRSLFECLSSDVFARSLLATSSSLSLSNCFAFPCTSFTCLLIPSSSASRFDSLWRISDTSVASVSASAFFCLLLSSSLSSFVSSSSFASASAPVPSVCRKEVRSLSFLALNFARVFSSALISFSAFWIFASSSSPSFCSSSLSCARKTT
mmetsp:Transcript_28791/g.65246  ORF Transcript_28791/g.65246 Transcript_28791/m.65246 type:complete len:219 (+) Transcript_28791:915-1571(+)